MIWKRHRLVAGALAALVALAPACTDEDDDGATTDEEVGEVEQQLEEGQQEVQEELEQGEQETEGEGG